MQQGGGFRSIARRPARSNLLLGTALSLVLGPLAIAPAAAQSAPATAATAPASNAIEEIVVTAERHAGTVQSTPLSITAVTGAQLADQGITNVSQLGYEVPGISERNSGPGQTEYEMRGISSSGGSSPTVGFYLDDVPLTAPVQGLQGKVVIDPNLYDLDRAEVLRGPQGTLYGSSSMGGTIRLLTNQPDLKNFSGSVEVGGTAMQDGDPGGGINAMINVPIVQDQVALRLVGTESYTGGWIDRIVASPFPQETNGGFTRGNVLAAPETSKDENVNWEHLQGIRASLALVPIDNLTITPSVFYQKITQGGPNYVDIPPGISSEAHYQPFNVSEPYSDSFFLASLPITYNFGDFSVTSITAYYSRLSSQTQDSSEVAQDFLTALIGIPDVSYKEAGALLAYENDHSHQLTQELRIASSGDSPFQWVAGAFYQDFDAKTEIGTTTPGPIVAKIFGAPSYFFLNFDNTLDQVAGFGEASYKLDDFKFTAGLRYYSYTTNQHQIEGGGLISGAGAPLVNSLPSQAAGFNPKFNLSYQPTDNLNTYLQASKGFRPGGANAPPPITCPSFPLQYNPDSIWSYEAGVKARPFDGQMTINASAYYENWTGIQQQVTLACGDSITTNAGTAHVYGGEVETAIKLSPEFTLTTGTAYTHARIASTLAGTTAFVIGERVQDVPDWTATAALSYKRPLDDTYDLVLRVADEYTGTMIDPAFQINHLPARQLVDVSAAVISEPGFSATVYIDNLADKRAYIDDPEEIFTFVPSINRAVTNQPRTFGVKLSYAF